MNCLSLHSLEYLAAIYLVSNTPDYLYDRYRAEQAVMSLGLEKSAVELVAVATEVARDQKRTPTDLAAGYAAIVALTFRDFGEVRAALSEARLDELEWAASILDIWRQTFTSAVSVTEKVKPKIQLLSGQTAQAPSAFFAVSAIKVKTIIPAAKSIADANFSVNLVVAKH